MNEPPARVSLPPLKPLSVSDIQRAEKRLRSTCILSLYLRSGSVTNSFDVSASVIDDFQQLPLGMV
jgi:hypothetical protein